MPPLLTLGVHRDDVLVDPLQTRAETARRKMDGSTHEGLTNGTRPIVLDGNGDNMGQAEGFVLPGNEAGETPDGNLGPGGVRPDVV